MMFVNSRIAISAGSSERVGIIVRDQGIGIGAPEQARIFDRFERAVSAGQYGGFGLGLWIARQIAVTSRRLLLTRLGCDIDVMRSNVFVAPFHEEPFRAAVDTIGASQVLFGSDWPHPEGAVTPRAMLEDLQELTEDETRQIVYDNPKALLRL